MVRVIGVSALLAVLAGVATVQGVGYPDYDHHGYPAAGHNGEFPGFLPAPIVTDNKPEALTRVDKLFARLAAVNKHLHILTEEVASVRTRVAVVNKAELQVELKLEELFNTNFEQELELENVGDLLETIGTDLAALNTDVSAVEGQNDMNSGELESLGEQLAEERVQITEAEESALFLEHFVPRQEEGFDNNLGLTAKCHENRVNRMKERATNLKKIMLEQKCETGTVTIHRDDHRATALFQNDFGEDVPNVLWGIAGYTFNLKARGVHEPEAYYGAYGSNYGFGHGYNYGYHSPSTSSYAEPNAIGVFIQATPANDGITFQTMNLGFGDSDLLTVKINYQACNIHSDFHPEDGSGGISQ